MISQDANKPIATIGNVRKAKLLLIQLEDAYGAVSEFVDELGISVADKHPSLALKDWAKESAIKLIN